MPEERRKAVRIKTSFIVQYGYSVDKDKKIWDMTTIMDISELGMYINTNRHFLPNEIISFRLKIPSQPLDFMEFNGRVIESKESKVGRYPTRIEFIDLKEEQNELIRAYTKWFLDKGGQKK